MSNLSPDRRGLLHHPPGSDFSDASTAIPPPILSTQRHAYNHMPSEISDEFAEVPLRSWSPFASNSNTDWGPQVQQADQGLGISRVVNLDRYSVEHRTPPPPPSPPKEFPRSARTNTALSQRKLTPGNLTAPSSNPWITHDAGNHAYSGLRSEGHEGHESEGDIRRTRLAPSADTLIGSFTESDGQKSRTGSVEAIDEHSKLLWGCPAKHDIHSPGASWLSISILLLSLYSTIFSGIWLVLAIAQPRYGRTIHSGGSLKPATASILFALLAKTIELSFVTVFVTFLGQVLSRRSLVKSSRGITIAELTMRTWVIQPGFMITHWQHLQHAALTILGAITLTAAFISMFYTTASDALVSPHLKYGKWEEKLLYGLVEASYANPEYIQQNCPTPISVEVDATYAGLTCLALEHAGQAYHNSLIFLDTWAKISASKEGVSSDINQRPQATGMLFDNTTITGSWIAADGSNMTAAFDIHKRIINNVTMAMPHAGVFAAARIARNGILQPKELEGVGEYAVRASVVSPSVNVLCANLNATELAPLIYVTWPNARSTNSTTIPGQHLAADDYENDVQVMPGLTYLNRTVVDEIFEWGVASPDKVRQPPIFPMYPIDYNSMTNISVTNSDSNYLLIKSASITDYTLCQIRSYLTPSCSTQYNVSGTTGGHLQSHCEDPSDQDAYANSVSEYPVNFNNDWRNVGSQWITSLSLNTGITNANSSTSRLLSQLVPAFPDGSPVVLSPHTPSIAETLAVMSGNTLLLSTAGSTFYHYWNYTSNILETGVYQPFNASLSTQQYTSGATQRWQSIFYLVLLLVFLTNMFCLVYFFLRSGLVTDYTEPQNLFALAVNSPPSQRLGGSCGAGPEGGQLSVDWHVVREEESGHFLIKEGDVDSGSWVDGVRRRRTRRITTMRVSNRDEEMMKLKSVSSYDILSKERRSWL